MAINKMPYDRDLDAAKQRKLIDDPQGDARVTDDVASDEDQFKGQEWDSADDLDQEKNTASNDLDNEDDLDEDNEPSV